MHKFDGYTHKFDGYPINLTGSEESVPVFAKRNEKNIEFSSTNSASKLLKVP